MDSRGYSRNIPPAYDEHMRHVSVAAKGDVEKLSDSETRSLLKKILKSMSNVKAGGKRKRELQDAPSEECSVMTSISVKDEQATRNLGCSRALAKELPELRAKLDILMKNHQSLCETVKYKTGLKVENVDEMKSLEHALIGITGKVESLCTEVSSAEKRANALIPCGVPNMDPGTSFHGNGCGYANCFDVVPMQIGCSELDLELSL